MKQYVSFQRLDIICSIQCLTEFYLKHFPKKKKRREEERTIQKHNNTKTFVLLEGGGGEEPNKPPPPSVLDLLDFALPKTAVRRGTRSESPEKRGGRGRAAGHKTHILISFFFFFNFFLPPSPPL